MKKRKILIGFLLGIVVLFVFIFLFFPLSIYTTTSAITGCFDICEGADIVIYCTESSHGIQSCTHLCFGRVWNTCDL